MWHASIGVRIGRSHALPVEAWPLAVELRVWKYAQLLLRDVGAGPEYRKRGTIVVHLRRSLSATEIAALDPAWLAIPAIDMA